MHKNIAASFQKIKYIFKKNYVNWFFYHNWFRLLVTFFLLAVLCVCLIEVFTEVWCLVETNILDSIGPLIQWYYNNRPDWLHAFFLSMWAIAQPILTGVVFCLHKVYGWLETIVETIIYCISPLFRESITDNFQFETAEMIISTVGISGFALNTINELKTKRSHGIALETVINHYYPCYHMFFLPHIAFFFSGMYACKISNERCALSNEWNEWLKDASSYPDMQELLVAVDVGITDYSSWAYDYVITKKPLFIYATDIEKYNGTRGFYYSLETTPFPICRNNEELQENVANFDNEAYLVKCDAFLEEKGCAETGGAAVKIVEFIKKECLGM